MACCEVCNGDEKRENSIMKTLLYRNDSVSSVLPTANNTGNMSARNTNTGIEFVYVHSFNN